MIMTSGTILLCLYSERVKKTLSSFQQAYIERRSIMTTTLTREQWLSQATEELRALFKQHGDTIPTQVRSSCGFPSKSALASKNRRIGECWSSAASADSHAEIFISPTISDSARVLDILAHELIHAVHPGDGHGKKFGKTARAIGLEGKLTATVAGAKFTAWATPVLARLGAYPHADLVPSNAQKKQTTRMLKCVCSDCGYTVRVAGKWLADMGAPHCPEHGEMSTESV
jgi:hypothetical protein